MRNGHLGKRLTGFEVATLMALPGRFWCWVQSEYVEDGTLGEVQYRELRREISRKANAMKGLS